MHARKIAYSLDLTQYDGIVTVSGDGVVVEVQIISHFKF
jgi:diacylglycerol kinase family enzyme